MEATLMLLKLSLLGLGCNYLIEKKEYGSWGSRFEILYEDFKQNFDVLNNQARSTKQVQFDSCRALVEISNSDNSNNMQRPSQASKYVEKSRLSKNMFNKPFKENVTGEGSRSSGLVKIIGGIWLLCNGSRVNLQVVASSRHFIMAVGPWVVMRDFNEIISSDEKRGGGGRGSFSKFGFIKWINENKLVDLGFIGQNFTWMARRGVREDIWERLDRELCSMDWRVMFGEGFVKHLPRVTFDHCPIMLCHHIMHILRGNFKAFRFNAEGFGNVFSHNWDSFEGKLSDKIRNVSQNIKVWNMKVFGYDGLPRSFPALEEGMLEGLVTSINEDEVRASVFGIGRMKAPRPDGFPAIFFQDQWNVCKFDLVKLVVESFRIGSFPIELNQTLITLIPKIPSPLNMIHLRPISLCNTTYKVISKVIVQRIRNLMPNLIRPNQVTFVPGRQIQDNFIVAQEVLHKFKYMKVQYRAILNAELTESFTPQYGRINSRTYGALVEKVQSRLAAWKSDSLSLAGNITFIKVVTSTLLVYTMQSVKLPRELYAKLDKLLRNFLWGHTKNKKGTHLVKWDTVCFHKIMGGLGIKRIKSMNQALLAKIDLRLLQNNVGTWCHLLKNKYLHSRSLTDPDMSMGGDFTVKSTYAGLIKAETLPLWSWRFIWKFKMPTRVQHFLWVLFHGKTLTNEQRCCHGGGAEQRKGGVCSGAGGRVRDVAVEDKWICGEDLWRRAAVIVWYERKQRDRVVAD
ncbi:hypothetical protein Ddye_021053 [Dipteronia dyeriana]|uniref:Reverse transcriptase zinc-binding domain-containing protein n=1 Tax=Dipteronia dyeriana TaxID=168575 RepID=A0AAD9WX58_9ROSI|nr:hypothetical protein Ddye_021053 [Dipteronia dyeriana]